MDLLIDWLERNDQLQDVFIILYEKHQIKVSNNRYILSLGAVKLTHCVWLQGVARYLRIRSCAHSQRTWASLTSYIVSWTWRIKTRRWTLAAGRLSDSQTSRSSRWIGFSPMWRTCFQNYTVTSTFPPASAYIQQIGKEDVTSSSQYLRFQNLTNFLKHFDFVWVLKSQGLVIFRVTYRKHWL